MDAGQAVAKQNKQQQQRQQLKHRRGNTQNGETKEQIT